MTELFTRQQVIITLLPLGLLIFIFLAITPVPQANETNCVKVSGRVLAVKEDGTKDVVLQLAGDNRTYYVNRGLEQGLDLRFLQAQLTGKPVELWYVRHWTPLDPVNRIRHLAKIQANGIVWHNEMAISNAIQP